MSFVIFLGFLIDIIPTFNPNEGYLKSGTSFYYFYRIFNALFFLLCLYCIYKCYLVLQFILNDNAALKKEKKPTKHFRPTRSVMLSLFGNIARLIFFLDPDYIYGILHMSTNITCQSLSSTLHFGASFESIFVWIACIHLVQDTVSVYSFFLSLLLVDNNYFFLFSILN